jgi:hypothetical protein
MGNYRSFSFYSDQSKSAAVAWMQPGKAPSNPWCEFWFDSLGNFNVPGGVSVPGGGALGSLSVSGPSSMQSAFFNGTPWVDVKSYGAKGDGVEFVSGVAGATIKTGGSGYAVGTAMIADPGNAQAYGCVIDITSISGGAITGFSIQRPGYMYVAGDVLTVIQSGATGGALTIATTTDSGGSINSGTTTFTCGSARFTPADVGKDIFIYGIGTSGLGTASIATGGTGYTTGAATVKDANNNQDTINVTSVSSGAITGFTITSDVTDHRVSFDFLLAS